MSRNLTRCGITLAMGFAIPAMAATCESLSSLPLTGITIMKAQFVAAGGFTPRAARGTTTGPALAAFCRVAATIRPTSDSDIKIEVWLPSAGWNGKLAASGNGGWSGSINPATLSAGLLRGYATAMTDLGREGPASGSDAPTCFTERKS
jgi:feruloyl esterase